MKKWAFLPLTMEYFEETGREGSFGKAAGDVIVGFVFGHQGGQAIRREW